jgi:heme exporter protein D
MIEGGWTFVWSAYAVAAAGLGALVVIALARFLHWRKAARALEARKESGS